MKTIKGSKNPAWTGYENISGTAYYNIKRGAERRGIDFNITIEECNKLWLLQNGKDFWTGQPLTKEGSSKASMDRRDSNLGYSFQNCVWVTSRTNLSKHTQSENEFSELARLIVDLG